MANRNFSHPRAYTKELVVIAGNAAIAADASAGALDMDGGSTFTKTGTGTYRLTLQDAFPGFKNVHVTKLEAAATAIQVAVKAYDAANKTVDFMTISSGSAADIAAALTLQITIHAKNSTAR